MFEGYVMTMQAVLDGVWCCDRTVADASDTLVSGQLFAPFPIAAERGEA
jgi:hypothetical protein